MKRLIQKEEGQSLVEFALILPIFLIILLGIIVLGQIFYSYMVIQNASRDAARYGTVWASDEKIIQVVQEKTSSLDQTTLNITIDPSASQRDHGEQIRVRLDYNVPLIIPMWKNVLPNPFPISAETVMRIE